MQVFFIIIIAIIKMPLNSHLFTKIARKYSVMSGDAVCNIYNIMQ